MPREQDPFEGWQGFEPLQRASTKRRAVLLVVGPLMWVVALAVFVDIVRNDFAVELGLLIAAATFLLAFLVLVIARRGRVHRERAG
jgi:hypothetical protein